MGKMFTPYSAFCQNRLSFLAVLVVFCRATQVLADGPLTLQTECQKGSTTQVSIALEVDGKLKLTADGKPETLPMKVAAKFAYHETRLDDCTPKVNRRAARFYTTAKATFQ